MYRRFPYREPYVLRHATPAAAAGALERLANAAAHLTTLAVIWAPPSYGPSGAIRLAIADLVYARSAWLARELVAPYSVPPRAYTMGGNSAQATRWIAAARGWRRRFPELLGR